MEAKKSRVPEKAEPISDIRSRWDWVEPSVWTDRMLEALEKGIKGVEETKWFCLIDKAYESANLMSAYKKAARNKGAAGVDHLTVKRFAKNLDESLERIGSQMRKGEYHPNSVRRSYIPKQGTREKRPLGIPTVRDRIAGTAIRHVIEPIFEKEFAECSYGFRPGLGCKDALREVTRLLKEGYTHVVDADISKCFERIPHEPLMKRVGERIADRKVLELIKRFLKQNIMEKGEDLEPEKAGTPQGATLSPLLCNIYLNPLDHIMEEHGVKMVRYADDLVMLCQSEADATGVMTLLQEWVAENGLELHPEKTRIVDMGKQEEYFDFLGYRFRRSKKDKLNWFHSPKSEKRLRGKLKPITRRANGQSMDEIIRRCNVITKGWYEYFKHGPKWGLRAIDGWIRMRLRSILRKRAKKKGRGRGSDHQKWPNSYFTKLGLFSMYAALEEASSPQRG